MTLDDAIDRISTVFIKANCSQENALCVARALVAAEADGLKGHGLSRIPTYAAQSLCGKVDGFAVPTCENLTPAMIRIDAKSGFAYPALALAESEVLKAIKQSGIVMVGVTHSHHAGVCGHVVERLAHQGYVSLMFANTPSAIAPWGGSRGVFGTNPIAFATPVKGQAPAVVDMALSKVARGPIVAAAQKGEAIPEGWALDADGAPTTDAQKALKGTMLPLGDAKGTALAFMVEVLAAGLTGANFAGTAPSFLDTKGGAPNTGQLLIVIDPMRFNAGYPDHLSQLITDIESQQGARIAGSRRLALREKSQREGIVINDTILKELSALGL